MAAPPAYTVEAYSARFARKLALPPGRCARALDLGCGSGHDLAMLQAHADRVVAMDVDAGATRKARREGVDVVRADARHLPFREGAFGLVFEKDVLHHVGEARLGDGPDLPGVAAALAEMRRVLRPGGHAVLVEANRFNPFFYLHMTRALGHEHFTRAQFERLVREAFPGTRLRQFDSHYYPARTRLATRALHALEAAFELPVLRALAGYNVAVGRRE
ncbi:MAG TPA: class I SAM-dependent methyltransferase [Candidatus Thermoplasmatota archaeon]|nr:class I SAM-dependent methyltransferase [Candidatus Thermoplasmatota archaeon]